LRASAPTGPVVPEENLPPSVRLAQPGEEIKPVPPPVSASSLRSSGTPPSEVALSVIGPEAAALPPSKPDEVHVQVEAPLVYRATDPPGAPVQDARSLPVPDSPPAPPLQIAAPQPAPEPKREHRGFFGKIGGFFAALFR